MNQQFPEIQKHKMHRVFHYSFGISGAPSLGFSTSAPPTSGPAAGVSSSGPHVFRVFSVDPTSVGSLASSSILFDVVASFNTPSLLELLFFRSRLDSSTFPFSRSFFFLFLSSSARALAFALFS